MIYWEKSMKNCNGIVGKNVLKVVKVLWEKMYKKL